LFWLIPSGLRYSSKRISPGCTGGSFFNGMVLSSMIIYYFNFISIVVAPDETNAELIINPDAMLSRPVAFEGFQSITRRPSQIRQAFGSLQYQ
jgi:hypothetical protein